MVEPAEIPRRIPEDEKASRGEKKRWGLGAKAGAIVGSTAAVVSGVAAALGETDNLPDPLQGFYDQAFHPGKVVEEKSDQVLRDKYDVKEANEDFAKIVNENKEEIPPETTVEEEIIEEVNAPEIEGLKFDQETKNYIAEAGNPYGFETGVEAGVYVKEAVEIDGEMEDAIGLKPEVIEFFQKKMYEEKKDFLIAIPFNLINLKDTEGVKINHLKVLEFSNSKQPDMLTLGINVPSDSVFYAIYSGEYTFAPQKKFTLTETEDKTFIININLEPELAVCGIDFSDGEILADVKEKSDYFDRYAFKIGEPMAVILSGKTVDRTANRLQDFNFSYENPGEYQFSLGGWVHDKEGKMRQAEVFTLEDIPVFILPNETVHGQTN